MEQNKTESPRKRQARRIGFWLFVLYICVLIYFLFFADWYDHAPGRHWEYHYNLTPFKEIRRFLYAGSSLPPAAKLLNLLGNVIGFLPFGFFLPVITRKFRNLPLVTLLGALFSFGVELIQLVTRTGVFDVDDIILNTIGAAAGYILFLICDRIRKEVQKYYGR